MRWRRETAGGARRCFDSIKIAAFATTYRNRQARYARRLAGDLTGKTRQVFGSLHWAPSKRIWTPAKVWTLKEEFGAWSHAWAEDTCTLGTSAASLMVLKDHHWGRSFTRIEITSHVASATSGSCFQNCVNISGGTNDVKHCWKQDKDAILSHKGERGSDECSENLIISTWTTQTSLFCATSLLGLWNLTGISHNLSPKLDFWTKLEPKTYLQAWNALAYRCYGGEHPHSPHHKSPVDTNGRNRDEKPAPRSSMLNINRNQISTPGSISRKLQRNWAQIKRAMDYFYWIVTENLWSSPPILVKNERGTKLRAEISEIMHLLLLMPWCSCWKCLLKVCRCTPQWGAAKAWLTQSVMPQQHYQDQACECVVLITFVIHWVPKSPIYFF